MGKFDDISLKPEDFGKTASTHTILTGPELDELFSTPEERKEFKRLLQALDEATASNQAQQQFIANISQFGGVVVKLLRLVVPI